MAWSIPRTWADGELPTGAQFNTEFRDNLNELALHEHQGGSGSGLNTIGGTAGILGLDFADAAPSPPTSNTLTRVFATAGTFGWINSASSTWFAANATHEHTLSIITTVAQQHIFTATSTVGGFFPVAAAAKGVTGSFVELAGQSGSITANVFTATMSATGSRLANVNVTFICKSAVGSDTSQTGTFRVMQQLDGTGSSEIISTQIAVNGSTSPVVYVNRVFSSVLASGSYRWYGEVRASADVDGSGITGLPLGISVTEQTYTGG